MGINNFKTKNIKMHPDNVGSLGINPPRKTWYHRHFGTSIQSNPSANLMNVKALFNGKNFTLKEHSEIIFEKPANSGRNEAVGKKIAQLCQGQETDVYMNNKKYTGVKDYGAIPEGQYGFMLSMGSTFTKSENLVLFTRKFIGIDRGGRDALGMVISNGDWGVGRVPLYPFYLDKQGSACGDPELRDKFYLHSGYFVGSAGCIELSNDHFVEMLKLLNGYPQPIMLMVSY